MIFSSKTSTLFILVKLVKLQFRFIFFITVFSNTVSKSENIYTEQNKKVPYVGPRLVGLTASQKIRHLNKVVVDWDAPQ